MRTIRLTLASAALVTLSLLPPGARAQAPGAPAAGAPAAGTAAAGTPAAGTPAAGSGATASTPAAAVDPVVARVGDELVHLSDLSAAAQALPENVRGMSPSVLYPLLLEQAIDRKALVLMARKQGLEKEPAVQRQLRRAEDQTLETALFARDIGPQITEAAVRARYERDIAGKPGEEEVHARHILVPTEAEARKIIAELAKGADFATLAKEHSTDPGGADGGDLGFFKKGDMVAAFADAAFAMKPGEVSKVPVKTQFGWHVIQVLARRQAKPETYEQAHDALRQKMIQEAMAALVKQAHAGVKIVRLNPDGSAPSLLDTAAPPAAGSAPAGKTP